VLDAQRSGTSPKLSRKVVGKIMREDLLGLSEEE
jgi:hypothetical protein